MLGHDRLPKIEERGVLVASISVLNRLFIGGENWRGIYSAGGRRIGADFLRLRGELNKISRNRAMLF